MVGAAARGREGERRPWRARSKGSS
jgi:hypothetical protein